MAFNATDWLTRARAFSEALKKHGLESKFKTGKIKNSSEAASGPNLPPIALDLLKSNASFSYKIDEDTLGGDDLPDEVWGGFEFKLSDLKANLQSVKEWAEETWLAEYPEDAATWLNSTPLIALQNGDFIAIDSRTSTTDPAVVYLNHEDAPAVLAPTLSSFLTAWEYVYYLGPEIWMLEPFLNDEGHLDPTTPAAQSFHQAMETFLKS